MELKNNWKLIIESFNNSINIKMINNFKLYSKKYSFEELLNCNIFKSYSKIEDIINNIKSIIEENKYDIEENYKNKINLILKNCSHNLILKLPKIKIDEEEIFELLMKEIKLIKDELNNKKISEDINKEIKGLKEEIKNYFKNEKLNNKDLNNEIICEYNIKEKNNIQILNCYEEVKKNNPNWKWDEIAANENEKEIKENSELYLNENKINFCYKYNFEKIGMNKINIKLTKYLNNTNFMFYKCSSLTSLNLSNFNTNNVNNMNNMFYNCSSLTSLNLSNFNTNNVNNMSWMFYNCSSLTSLNLSNFKTNNVNNMSWMFHGCSSLTSLNLSNFNTNNVKDMNNMFSVCSSLTSLNLSNFKTNNVNNMSFMFCGCSSLTSLNLSNFKTNNVNDMSGMLSYCSSLTSLNLSNFNTNNVNNMSSMFEGLNKNCEIKTNDNKILEIIKTINFPLI